MERCVIDTSVLISKRLDAALQRAERYVASAVLLEYVGQEVGRGGAATSGSYSCCPASSASST
ncbi:MAG: hypothetical protein RXR06_11950 [Thermoproteus sp.]